MIAFGGTDDIRASARACAALGEWSAVRSLLAKLHVPKRVAVDADDVEQLRTPAQLRVALRQVITFP